MADIVERLEMLEKGRMWRGQFWIALQDDHEVATEAYNLALDAADQIKSLRTGIENVRRSWMEARTERDGYLRDFNELRDRLEAQPDE